jgi:hypothetical protein
MKIKFVLLLCIILLFGNVSALGITPARNTIDFSPNLETEGSFTIINSESREMNIVVYAQGELSEGIYLTENSFLISSGESSKKINYNLKLPANLKPGLNTGEIVVMSLPGKGGTSEAFVGAALAVIHQVHVYVKYPGKYAESDLNVIDANQNEEVVFVIPVFSRGEHDLVSVKANIDIYNQLGEKITTFNTVDISVKSGERREIVHKWKAEVPIGRYLAKVTLIYDGETRNMEKQFKVGQSDLELQNIELRNFRLGEIAKFEMLVENKWSEPIRGAHTQMQIFNNDNQLISDVKSASYDFAPFSKEVLVSYWDTAGAREGNYNTKLFLNYGEQSIQKNIELRVSKDSIRVIGLGYVISEESRGRGSLTSFLVVLVILLILLNLFWFLVLRRKLKKR